MSDTLTCARSTEYYSKVCIPTSGCVYNEGIVIWPTSTRARIITNGSILTGIQTNGWSEWGGTAQNSRRRRLMLVGCGAWKRRYRGALTRLRPPAATTSTLWCYRGFYGPCANSLAAHPHRVCVLSVKLGRQCCCCRPVAPHARRTFLRLSKRKRRRRLHGSQGSIVTLAVFPMEHPIDVRRLRGILAERRITHRELARASGLARTYLSSILSGTMRPGELAQIKIARGIAALGLDNEVKEAQRAS